MSTHPLFRVRYWRSYHWPFQLLMLLLLVFTIASLFSAISFVVVPALTGYQVYDTLGVSKASPRGMIDAALIYQGLTSLGIFVVPALLYAYLSHPRPGHYLGLRTPGKSIHWPLAVGTILGAAPAFIALDSTMRKLLGSSETQEMSDRLTQAFLESHTLPQLLLTLLVAAVIPALGEELFFRGVLYRFVAKKTSGIWPAIIGSALFFAAVHFNPSGMIAIFLAGVLFALFYYLTGSLWTAILAHFVYNGGQAVLMYAVQQQPGLKAQLENSEVPITVVLAGLVLFSICLYLLWKHRTPLPLGWAVDTDEPAMAVDTRLPQ